jgi:hypothetical protein
MATPPEPKLKSRGAGRAHRCIVLPMVRACLACFCLTLLTLPSEAAGDPLLGSWGLNVGRSHYGAGTSVRRQESFACREDRAGLRCTIESLRADGERLTAKFTATYGGPAAAVLGMPDVDQVSLQKIDDFVADATFSFKGRAVFGYRALKSSDGRSLTIVSVDPIARTVLRSVVVYDRQ